MSMDRTVATATRLDAGISGAYPRPVALRGVILVSASLLVACGGDDDAPPLDGGTDADAAVDPLGIDLPAPPSIPWYDESTGEESLEPAPPSLGPCPDGWRAADDACEAYPETGPVDCADGEAHFPGRAGCERLGSACPTTSDFADGLADDGTVIFVRDGAPAGGDGSRGAPFATIAEAIAAAAAGNTIALSRGLFEEAVELLSPVTLRGACVEETTISAGAGVPAVITSRSPDVVVRDLRVADSFEPGLIAMGSGNGMTARGVLVQRATGIGAIADTGGHLVLDRVVIEDTQPIADGRFGRGLLAQNAGTVDASWVAIQNNREYGVETTGAGSQLTLTDTIVRDTLPSAAGIVGDGVRVDTSGSTTLERVVISGNTNGGVVAAARGEASLSDSIVRDTRPRPSDGFFGRGLVAFGASSIDAARVLLDRNHTSGAASEGSGSNVTLTDVIIRDSQPNDGGNSGRGVEAALGGRAALVRARIERCREQGVLVFDDAAATLEDVVISDIEPIAGPTNGMGILVAVASSLTGDRVRIQSANAGGIVAIDPGTTAVVRDLVVRDTVDIAGGIDASGFGIDLRDGATLDVERGVIDDNDVAGASSINGATLTLADVVVRDTAPRTENGFFGFGVSSQFGGTSVLRRVLLENNSTIGVIANDPESRVTAEDLTVRDQQTNAYDGASGMGLGVERSASATITRALFERTHQAAVQTHTSGVAELSHVTVLEPLRNECEACPLGRFGVGFGVYVRGAITANRFRIADAPLCGVQVGPGGQADLTEGEISGAQIGACIHETEYDVGRVTDGVRYRDNEVNLETVDFPIPEPTPSLGGG
jgi:hypothetical protein